MTSSFNFAELEKAIKCEEHARMAALAAQQGGNLRPGQRQACMERMVDRLLAARTSFFRQSIAQRVPASARP